MNSRLLSTFAIAVMTATTAMADEFVVDGLKYSTSSYGDEVTVTGYTTPAANLEKDSQIISFAVSILMKEAVSNMTRPPILRLIFGDFS